MTLTSAKYEGILPPPTMMAEYNNIVADGAERIMRMAELNGEHRRNLETISVKGEHRRAMAGVIGGGSLGIMIAICGTIVTVKGYPEVGVAMVGGDLASIVGSFIYGTESRRRERIARTELMTGNIRSRR